MSGNTSEPTDSVGTRPQFDGTATVPDSAFKASGVGTTNKTADHPDVNVATRADFNSLAEVSEAVENQETVAIDDDSVRCAGGDHGIRTYLTDLPVIRREDMEPGVIVYRPTPSPLPYVLTSEPYTNDQGRERVDAKFWTTTEDTSGNIVVEHVHETSLFVSAVLDEMTFFTKSNVQTTLC